MDPFYFQLTDTVLGGMTYVSAVLLAVAFQTIAQRAQNVRLFSCCFQECLLARVIAKHSMFRMGLLQLPFS